MNRNILLDSIRGLAVVLMLIFHLAVDLEDFYGWQIGYRLGWWKVLNFLIVFLFLLVAGFTAGKNFSSGQYKNAGKLLLAALLVTLATYFFDSATYVRFGILHLLAALAFLAPALRSLKAFWLILLGVLAFLVGEYFASFKVSTSLFLPLGLRPVGFQSLDYYPLFPWLSFYLLGMWSARKIALPSEKGQNIFLLFLACLGRRALLIYLIHQPLFLLFLKLTLG